MKILKFNESVIPYRYISGEGFGDEDSDGPYLKIITTDGKKYIVSIKNINISDDY